MEKDFFFLLISRVYYESIKREPKIRGIKKCRCDERLQTKTKNLRASHTLGSSKKGFLFSLSFSLSLFFFSLGQGIAVRRDGGDRSRAKAI